MRNESGRVHPCDIAVRQCSAAQRPTTSPGPGRRCSAAFPAPRRRRRWRWCTGYCASASAPSSRRTFARSIDVRGNQRPAAAGANRQLTPVVPAPQTPASPETRIRGYRVDSHRFDSCRVESPESHWEKRKRRSGCKPSLRRCFTLGQKLTCRSSLDRHYYQLAVMITAQV